MIIAHYGPQKHHVDQYFENALPFSNYSYQERCAMTDYGAETPSAISTGCSPALSLLTVVFLPALAD